MESTSQGMGDGEHAAQWSEGETAVTHTRVWAVQMVGIFTREKL